MTPLKLANETLAKYKKWVSDNPQHITEIETFSRYLSYFVAGKINKSPVFSELVYATSNLFTLYNDILIRKSQSDDTPKNTAKERLKLWLTILHYCEVFVELTLRNKWGDRGKWTAATSIQFVRCIANLVLIHKFSETPVQQPPVPTLQRKKFADDNISKEFNNDGFVLKRSGRIVRKVEGTPPASLRNWKPLGNKNQAASASSSGDFDKKKIAETIYAIKPLIHLGSVACFGTESWKQWLTYLGCDLLSLHLYSGESASLNYEQSIEVNRRKLSLLLYLLRSPMYRKYSASVIDSKLTGLSKKIPFTAFICNPIIQYISHWQDTYFYMWSN